MRHLIFSKKALAFFAALFLIACQSDSTFEERRALAKTMLKTKFDVVVNASTELIAEKHPLMAAGARLVLDSKCDCITDSLAVRFANKYDMVKLKELETAPIESLQLTVEELLAEDDHCVMNCITNW